jgi:adenylate cyclase class 2
MGLEREAKYRVSSLEPVRHALTAAGAEPRGQVLERNHVFDRPDGELRLRQAALRLREFGPGTPALLTFKGPASGSRFKIREEIEVSVSDAAGMLQILTAAGFVRTVYYEKRRESWRLGDCDVELDELPELGFFVEIEGPSDAAIETARQTLGLDHAEHLTESYLALIAQHCRQLGRPTVQVAFPP